jgi:hypothetical protein
MLPVVPLLHYVSWWSKSPAVDMKMSYLQNMTVLEGAYPVAIG